MRPKTFCTVNGCDRVHLSRGYCQMHYGRVKRNGIPGEPAMRKAPAGSGYFDALGYHHLRIGGKKVAAHRAVMEKKLGRPLRPGENVHHVNGVPGDNRPENLELWIVMQPSGQRPADLVAWAHEIIDRYEKELVP